ncbi:class I SAM-dependent methyltransferase [Aeromicrobium sp. A1-2]|uniref:class I SAM-dependent methyltransferase n=1 Tax=Aeromicrobium sp. A1-2 TaxID=2107713 RepID=UPI000E52DB5A|nr:class I SAM-dependent methyltransferase [Aeromicrobium sp. A1-2]AXT84967.1 class I SAM-dependent methyltransferase [Aeromicrobium sp. A1-2]
MCAETTDTTRAQPMTGDMTGSADWNVFYAERSTIWSGEPNAQLVAEATGLSPGSALDVGCGEGADAVWLAQHGWDVTAVDVSDVALKRAREHAATLGCEIEFVHLDVVATPPQPKTYDLVSAQFFQLEDPPRSQAMRSLGASVALGGHLLVVGHYPAGHAGANHPERLFTLDEIIGLFSPDDWAVVTSETRERTAMHHGEITDLVDGVVLLRRTGQA